MSIDKQMQRLVLRDPARAQKMLDEYEQAGVALARQDSAMFCE